MKRAAALSHYKNVNISTVVRATTNASTDEDNNITFLSEGDSVVFVGKCKNIILNTNQTWISISIGRCECFGIDTNTHEIETTVPLEEDVEKW